jgi:hypothetical protein
MPRPQDDDLARASDAGRRQPPTGRSAGAGDLLNGRTVALAVGFLLAAAATLAVFLTDNRQYLRVAVVAVAWAFVLATLAAGRRGADRATAAAREDQLRHAYELELEREVAARREYELDLERDLRRESEDAMREEFDALREEVARVSDLRHDLAGLASLRDDIARVAALREDVAALSSLRQDLGQLSELRADMNRLRAELTEQLSSEMLIERIVMRTQGGARFEPGRSRDASPLDGPLLDVPSRWSDDTPPRELTGGWPAIRLDEPREIRRAAPLPADRPLPGHDRLSPAVWSSTPETSISSAVAPPPPVPADSRTPTAATETPLEWLTARSMLDPDAPRPVAPPPVPPRHVAPPPVPQSPATEARPAAFRPSPHPRPQSTPPSVRSQPDLAPVRRRSDDPDASTAERPQAPGGTSTVAGHQAAPGGVSGPAGTGDDDGRLAEILAENGVSPSTGNRRRRRYREDDEPDDVLARVLGLR